MLKIARTCALAGATLATSLVMASSNAAADEAREFGYSLTLQATSDYMFRGISYNNEDPAFQPYLEFTYGIAYLAFGGSNIADPFGPFEFDSYLGIRPETGPIKWDLGVLWYQYPSARNASDADYVEFKVGASTTIKDVTLGLTGFWTPDQGEAYVETLTIEGTASYTLPAVGIFTPTLSGTLGYTRSPEPTVWFFGEEDYVYWNAGVRLSVEKFFFDLRYWDTNLKETAANGYNVNTADSRFVFTAGITLP